MSGSQAARVAVLGPGSWGTALALLLARNGHAVRLWGHDPNEVAALARDRENRQFLPGVPFPDGLVPLIDLDEALAAIDALLIVVPSHAFAAVAERLAPRLPAGLGVAWATKGFAPGDNRLLHQVAGEVLGERPLAVVSGPSFAAEVARGLPTAVTVAATAPDFAQQVAGLLHGGRFRAYTSDDLVGVEVAGAAKNVLAIATGIADGLGFGANTRAALITRGLAELIRLGTALGGRRETFMGLAGLGDLVLTCTDDQSRNRRMGLALAKGRSVADARREIGQEVEGVLTARSVRAIAERLGVEMPIGEQVYRVLYEGATPEQATRALLERESKAEFD
ncbi:NAD(P)H-dependent glycerol-3-phosphate dehydrogenase [Thiococcus pfennigii]|uniref:NAD(P)H-dependent glycerol-3-phosphate dehydrogenase n=1 Tax=Thiococcus pfennigii TaxID=1057 RepID=UPI0019075D00|nr:NAD(P)H-dependent glycerol-3-phosphate dehydrogenase [Thiococcus pfennigii]MBK1733160.1 glycerol-3-phosphate dehydrogenase [Thiococcus pfennigii]